MAQWQRVGFQIPRLGVRIPLASEKFVFIFFFFFDYIRLVDRSAAQAARTPWRNGSAWDSKSQGWGFESLWRQEPP